MPAKSSKKQQSRTARLNHEVSFQEKMEILFNFHQQHRLKSVEYLAIRKQTKLSTSNIHRLYKSSDSNPRMTTIRAILAYFDTPWGYLDCRTRDECLTYLTTLQEGASAKTLAHGLRSYGLSGEAADIVMNLILYLWRKEKGDKRKADQPNNGRAEA